MRKILAYSLLIMGSLVLFSMSAPVKDILIITKKKYSKTVEKTFPIDSKGEVAITNKYGNIEMLTWDKDKVQIKVDIVVNATSESVAEDVFESIAIEFSGSKDLVSAETVIETKSNYWWNWGKNIKSDFEINYEIYMPATCSVNFDNKYGNINMMDLDNDAEIDVKYGNFTMGDLEGDLTLYLGYGNGYIGAVQDVQAEVSYSKLRCDYVKDFTGQTKYSGITINSARKITVETKYDNYNVGEVIEFFNEGKYDNLIIDQAGAVVIETKYTDLKIGQLKQSLSAELSYGGIKIKELDKGFEEISVESNYAGIQIGVQESTRFDLQLQSKYVEVELAESMDVKVEEDGSEKHIQGKYNGGGKGKISLEMDYGFVKIK